MKVRYRQATPLLIVALLAAAACAPSQPSGGAPAGTGEPAPRAKTRITAALLGEPKNIKLTYVDSPPAGSDAAQQLLNSGMTVVNADGQRVPQLTEAVPTVENGLWRVLSDGRMQVTWKLRPGTRWHDGTPLTGADLAFTVRVDGDREVPIRHNATFDLIEGIQEVDPQTMIVTWKRPYINADTLYSVDFAMPIPKHLLEEAYLKDKEALLLLPFWTHEFIGSGPFKLRDWAAGSHMVLEANELYALGRPKIDEIEVKFIPDSNALLTNIAAGAVELTLGRSLSIDQAGQLRDQWRDGRVIFQTQNWIVIWPNVGDPRPAVIGNIAFRRALYHAIDRQQMADSIIGGMAPVADVFLSPSSQEYAAVKDQVVRYPYDPRLATQMIENLGYSKDGSGFFQDPSGRRLSVEVRATADNDIHHKTIFPVADFWQRVGVEVEPVLIPPQRQQDNEYRNTYPGLEMGQTTNALDRIQLWFSTSQLPTPQNRFTGQNRIRHSNPEWDALVDRYSATIPMGPRMQLLGQMVHHVSDQILQMGVFYLVLPTMVANRIQNVTAALGSRDTQAWNAHEWGVT